MGKYIRKYLINSKDQFIKIDVENKRINFGELIFKNRYIIQNILQTYNVQEFVKKYKGKYIIYTSYSAQEINYTTISSLINNTTKNGKLYFLGNHIDKFANEKLDGFPEEKDVKCVYTELYFFS